jgi:integrase
MLVAQRIQSGMASTNDISPAQRECYLAVDRLASSFNMPAVVAMDEYARCRNLLGEVPLMVAVQEFVRRTKGMTLGVKVPDIVPEMIEAKKQDQLSSSYLSQLAITARRFAEAFPDEINSIGSGDIDRWLRGLGGSPVTRNSIHRCIKVLFSFAKSRGYLPRSEATAPEMLPLAKVGDTVTEIFQPHEIQKLLEACPAHLLGFVAIGAFAGLRVAEIGRLEWSAVDLDRGIIMLRADQAKTASRRIVPINRNLDVWLRHLNRRGFVTQGTKTGVEVTALARKLGIKWPHNGLRHSYISYRIAEIKDAARVALEAGNSPEIIFKHYRELVTEQEAQEWFSITPPECWVPPPSGKRHYSPRRKRA